jgi:diaminopimelate decarboxylase
MLHQHLWPTTARVNAHGHLEIGGCDTLELTQRYDTPLYALDEATFRGACRAYKAALARHHAGPSQAHYASKALLNTAVARMVAEEGLGLDVVSGGELFVALRAGMPAERIHLHGNAKPRAELEEALAAGIGQIVADNLDELALLAQLTAGRSVPQAIALRLTPDIAPDTHAHITTGHAASKFGLPLDALDAAAAIVRGAPGLELRGLHAHLGSQVFDYAPLTQAVGVLLDCAARLRDRHGIAVDEINPGGGLGAPYTAEQPLPDVDAYVAAVAGALAQGCAERNLPLPKLTLEPGRSIAARSGVALYTVVGSKALVSNAEGRTLNAEEELQESAEAVVPEPAAAGVDSAYSATPRTPSAFSVQRSAFRYLHIDGGMGDNIRPALYGARYTALLAARAGEGAEELVHIAGRYCESGDVLLRDVPLPRAGIGDVLAIAGAGAYTLSMASNYNLVPRPAVVLVADGALQVAQRRETYADLVARDT